ncbi:hypothetical protein HUW51_14500 [Adhaeribacter swui]|uniref:Uncharacterized protein n=1 Tax=Adhaeribacter swui TaxID=2086471 RepID=A0A7G7G9N8_9BACT|nr:hypothetical protein [Adhaeribacter swui]QNF33872.1 hypothetical protein HUW51_14500 [Adhaeribacter swui]
MKKATFLKNQLITSVAFYIIIVGGLLSACKNDKDEVAPAGAFAGKYTAEDSSSDTYIMTIEKKEGNKLIIHNFGGFMYVPIQATASGNNLTIPKQTFKESHFELTLKGTGNLAGDNLQIHYEASGSTNYEEDIWAVRK